MNLEKIPLKTVRQFFIQDVVLADYEDAFTPETPQVTKKVEDFCYAKVTASKQHPPPSIHLGRPPFMPFLTFRRSWRCWKRLREKESGVRSPRRSPSSA